MFLTSHHTLSLAKLGEQSFAGKIRSIHKAFNQTYLIHLKPHPQDIYHQLIHLDQHTGNILWVKNFKATQVLIGNSGDKILIVSYSQAEGGNIIQMYDMRENYKLVSTKISREYLSRGKQGYLINEYFLSKCGQSICFLEYQKKQKSPSIFIHVYKLQTLELQCPPVQIHSESYRSLTFGESFIGGISVSKFQKIQQMIEPNQEPIAPQNPNNNLGMFGSNQIVQHPPNNIFGPQNNILFAQPKNTLFAPKNIFPNLNNQNGLNQTLRNKPIQILPQNQPKPLPVPLSLQKKLFQYQFQLLFTQYKHETINFKSKKYTFKLNTIKQKVSIIMQKIEWKNEKQMVFCFKENDKNNDKMYTLHFYGLNLEDSNNCLQYIGFTYVLQQPGLPTSIQKLYSLDDKIVLVFKTYNYMNSKPAFVNLWLQKDETHGEMIKKESQRLQVTNHEGFVFKSREKGENERIQIVREEDGKLKIERQIYAEMKGIYVHFLLYINQDFDDDLLSDAIGMMLQDQMMFINIFLNIISFQSSQYIRLQNFQIRRI